MIEVNEYYAAFLGETYAGLLGKANEQSMLFSVFDAAAKEKTRYYFKPQKYNETKTKKFAKLNWAYLEYLQKWIFDNILSEISFSCRFSRTSLYTGVQLPDEPIDIKSISGQGRRGWNHVYLIPDFYYFDNRGYENFLVPGDPAFTPWERRSATVFWRGSTTGYIDRGAGFARDIDTLDGLPRYRLCHIASTLGQVADMGIDSVAQAGSDAQDAIEARLRSEGLMRAPLPVQRWAAHKFIVDIDGNASEWNLVQRMRLGCCVLKIDSPWIQWLSDRLTPWVHFVPVTSDLSDLREKVDWCLTHDKEAEQIATQAREFALSMTFEAEMQEAAFRFVEASEPIDGVGGQDFLHFQDLVRRVKLSEAPVTLR